MKVYDTLDLARRYANPWHAMQDYNFTGLCHLNIYLNGINVTVTDRDVVPFLVSSLHPLGHDATPIFLQDRAERTV